MNRFYSPIVACVVLWFVSSAPTFAQGVFLRAVSAKNEGMAGVAAATPVDSLGALHWNPATITAFDSSSMSFGSAIVLASATLDSSFQPPGQDRLTGSTRSNTGAVPAPFMGLIMQNPESPWTFGFSLDAIGGAQVNFAGTDTNPILSEEYGLGRTSAKVEAFQLTPAASLKLTDKLSVGLSPNIVISRLIAEPLFFGPTGVNPMTDNAEWGKGAGTRYTWGCGFQVGLFYETDANWNFGFSYRSQTWAEKFPYNVTTADGNDHEARFRLRFPPVYIFGISYDGFEDTIIGCDMKYFDYAKTPGFEYIGVNPDGSAKGLGWQSVFSVAVAAQHKLNSYLTVRGGYSFNENPITSQSLAFNVPCPLILQQGVHCGATVAVRGWEFDVAYTHMFKNTIDGTYPRWAAVDPEAYIRMSSSADVIAMGVTRNF
ncbi:MAG: outer membrane protein transport protein [Planctomycetia bacterium]|nr:outer membrane protein transport protein [Planctomycetia bacterium]